MYWWQLLYALAVGAHTMEVPSRPLLASGCTAPLVYGKPEAVAGP